MGEISCDFRMRSGSLNFTIRRFLIRLKSWLVVAVPIVRCCFDGNGVQERANAWDCRLETGRLFAQHTNDNIVSFEVVRYD